MNEIIRDLINTRKIVKPLYELTRKKQKWEWKIRQEKSFEVLKKRCYKIIKYGQTLIRYR